MKMFPTALPAVLAACLLSTASPAYTSSMTASGGAIRVEEPDTALDVTWALSYPIAAEGWSADALARLRALADAQVTGGDNGPAEPWIRARAKAAQERPLGERESVRRLVFSASLAFPVLTDGLAVIVYDGYEDEGGAGCHARGRFLTVRREPFGVLSFDWLTDDPAALRAAIVARLPETFDDTGDALPDFMPLKSGIRFRFAPYTVGPGSAGMPETTLTWDALAPLCRPEALTVLKAAVTPNKGE